MRPDRRTTRRGHRSTVLALAVSLLTLSGYGQVLSRQGPPDAGTSTSGSSASGAESDLYASARPARRVEPEVPTGTEASAQAPEARDAGSATDAWVAEPVRLEIPKLLVDADVIPLGTTDSGELQVPADPDQTGYWSGGPRPGEVGAAVIAGHIDSHEGPAVFYALRDLAPGDQLVVHRADDSAVTFEVTELAYHPKDDFPTEDVYGHTDRPTLRLITCGGSFDRETGHYLSNLVVYAEPVVGPDAAR